MARNEPKEKQKLYGQANFTLSKLVNAPGSSLTKPLKDALEAPVGGDVIIGAKAIDTDQSVSTVSFRPIIDMTHFIANIINDNKIINMFPLYENWIDIGQMEEFERANNDENIFI